MFKEVEHNDYYKVMENGKYGIGIYPVLFGFRVRVWELGAQVCECDLCFGDNQFNISAGYTVVKRFIEKGGNPRDIPFQEVKPYPNECEFTDWVNDQFGQEYIGRTDFVHITHLDIMKYRKEEFSKLDL